MRHLLSIDQFDLQEAEDLLSLAKKLEPIARRRMVTRVLEGAVLANLFFEASTRTRISFDAAFCRLGGAVSDTTGFTFSSMAKGESIHDTSRVVSGYADVIVVRHPEKGSVAEFARATNVPVINGGDGPGEHPTQALLDLYTVKQEFARVGREVDAAHVVLLGDLKYGRTVHSLIKLLSMYSGLRFTLVSPPTLKMPPDLVDRVRARGHKVRQVDHPAEAERGIDLLYATRIQKERFTGEVLEDTSPRFQVNKELVSRVCSQSTVIMHPLPRDSAAGANDLSVDLNDDPRLAIFRQSDAGIPVRMAIFAKLLGVESLVLSEVRPAKWMSPECLGPEDAPFYTFK
jgi:aspartate carbamoyltransferase catalytic subunit